MRIFLMLLAGALSANAQNPLHLHFEQNLGQYPPGVQFVRRSSGTLLYVTRDSVVLGTRLRIQLPGLPVNSMPTGDSPSTTAFHYFQGRNNWRTDIRLHQGVRWDNILPGVSARLGLAANPAAPVLMASLTITAEPGFDLDRFRISIPDAGTPAQQGPGSIWFTGGAVPGVFAVSAKAAQMNGRERIPIAAELNADGQMLFVKTPDRNAALATEIEIMFPTLDLMPRPETITVAADGSRYFASTVTAPTDFGEDGKVDAPACAPRCKDAVAARVDASGRALWLSIFGGAHDDTAAYALPTATGVAVAGTTASESFPVTANAPRPRMGSTTDVFLTFFDRDSGHLRSATYGGATGPAWLAASASDAGREIAVGGGYPVAGTVSRNSGFLLRWAPVENRLVFSLPLDAPVHAIAFGAQSRLYFASVKELPETRIRTGILDASGVLQGPIATIPAPVDGLDFWMGSVRLLPAEGGSYWLAYQATAADYQGRVMAARVTPGHAHAVVTRRIATGGYVHQAGLTPKGNLKVLVHGPSPTEFTTPDAPLVAACSGSSYYAILSPAGDIAHATYVPGEGFDFENAGEPTAAARATIGCAAHTASRRPLGFIAPGQLITLTGGGFGPAASKYFPPNSSGAYPVAADGLRVRVDGRDAHIAAVARGLIAVQVPYELEPFTVDHTIDVFDGGSLVGRVGFHTADQVFALFETGSRDNARNMPQYAALNEDGSANSPSNPAAIGSVISLFGTGLGRLAPDLVTGGLSPAPPKGPLSETGLYRACQGCEILYLGSAPGLSTAVSQVNVRLTENPYDDTETGGIRRHVIRVAVNSSPRGLNVSMAPPGVVWVK